MSDYVLVGGGAFAREILGWFTPGLASGDRFAGYLDDGEGSMATAGYDLPHLGPIGGFRPSSSQRLVMALTDPAGKAAVVERLADARDAFAALIHSRAWRTRTAVIGRGVVVGPFADISADARVGDFATVNGYASVGHDAELGAFSTLSGYVDLTGFVKVGERCFFGSGARVLPKVVIGADATIGAGAVVVRTGAAGSTMYAAPARRL